MVRVDWDVLSVWELWWFSAAKRGWLVLIALCYLMNCLRWMITIAIKSQIRTAGWRTPTVKKHRRVSILISVRGRAHTLSTRFHLLCISIPALLLCHFLMIEWQKSQTFLDIRLRIDSSGSGLNHSDRSDT